MDTISEGWSERGQIHPSRLTKYPVTALQEAWVEYLAQWIWNWFATLTFKHDVHPEAADKSFRKWIAQLNDEVFGRRWEKRGEGINWARALEWQRRGVIHFHCLLGDPDLDYLRRLEWSKKWLGLAGFSRIERPRNCESVRRYCAKYVTKGGQIDIGGPLKAPSRVVETLELGGGVLVG